ncbi:MAG: hypothetical protein IKO68_11755 [Oscillospiraceae bacterium]|nr:hypothetical protein [Oscillospiraceae bacterium]
MPTLNSGQAVNHNNLGRSLSNRALLMNQILKVKENQYPQTAGRDYLEYHSALSKLNGLMDRHSAVEDEDGLPKVLEEDGKQELIEAIRETARTGEVFLRSLQSAGAAGTVVGDVPVMVTRLQNLLFDDYEVLNAYNPEEAGLSFPELQENARTQIVDFRGMDLKKLGGAQSTRLAMTVVDEKGCRREGVFTKASYVNVKANFDKILQRVNAEYDKQSFTYQAEDFAETLVEKGYHPGGKTKAEDLSDTEVVQGMKQQVNDLIPRYRKYLSERNDMIRDTKPEDASEELLIGHFAQKIHAGIRNGTKPTALLNEMGYSAETLSNQAFSILEEGLTKYSYVVSDVINTRGLLLKDGDRLDQRNSAMSAVASILGVPELVARAENMKYLDEKGDVREGTFMEFSKGLDLYGKANHQNLKYISEKPFTPPCGIFKSLADLQILDYICGNVDRHGGNMTYIVDDQGIFQGVQAIDNDSSFGLGVPGKDGRYNNLFGTNDLRVMSASMAERVSSLSPDMLRFALRGRGLKEEEIGAACRRLTDLQDAIQTRSKVAANSEEVENAGTTLCVMGDNALNSLKLSSVMNTDRNIIHAVVTKFVALVKRERNIYPYEPNARRKEAEPLREVGTTDRRYVAGGIADTMQGMSRAIQNSVTGFKVGNLSSFLRSSDQFRSMVKAVKNAKATADRIRKEIGGDKEHLDRYDPRVKEQRDKADEAMQKVRQAAETYLQKKIRERGGSIENVKGKNEYERKRIEYARNLLKEVAEYEALNNRQNEKTKEERTQAVERARRGGLRKARPNKPKNDNPAL